MNPDEKLMVLDDKHQGFSEKLQGFSDPPSMNLDEELTLNSDQRGFLYPLEPPSKSIEEELMIVDPVVEVEDRSQAEKEEGKQKITSDLSGRIVVQDIEHETNMGLTVEEQAIKSVDEAAEADNLEYHTFSLTNHRFNMILKTSQVSRKYCLFLPTTMVEVLPQEKVPAVLNYHGKIWNTFYNGHLKAKVFEYRSWKTFVLDNKLKTGDCCFFELLENSSKKITFKVVILRTDSSPSCVGKSTEKPILIE